MSAKGLSNVARRIAEVLSLPETESRLDVLALLVAQIEYPGLNRGRYLRRLDELAAQVRLPSAGAAGRSPQMIIGAINCCLFKEEKFRGNEEDYYDPRNSFLNDVLERHTGIPILLSAIYVEIGRWLGFPFRGIGFPGHFLVLALGPPALLVDPFHGGQILTKANCEQRLRETYGSQGHLDPAYLRPVDNRYIVTRMLNNLRGIYHSRREYRKEIAILDVLLELNPHSAEQYKQRALPHHALQNYGLALADFEKYLELATKPSDADDILGSVVALKRLLASMN